MGLRSRAERARPGLHLWCGVVGLPREPARCVVVAELEDGNGGLRRPFVEAIGGEDDLPRVGDLLRNDAVGPLIEGDDLAGQDCSAGADALTEVVENTSRRTRRNTNDEQLRVVQAKEANRVTERRTV